MNETGYRQSVLEQFQEKDSDIQEAQINSFVEYTFKYYGKTPDDLLEAVADTIEAEHFNWMQKKKNKNAKLGGKELVDSVLKNLKKEVLDKINLAGGFTSVAAASAPSGSNVLKANITKTNQAKVQITKHSESHPQKGVPVKTWNKDLDFARAKRNFKTDVEIIVGKPDIAPNAFYSKVFDLSSSFRSRYYFMENLYKETLSQKGISYQRLVSQEQTLLEPKYVLCRLTFDDDEELLPDRVACEIFDQNDKLKEHYLNFTRYEKPYQLFPNQYLMVEITGSMSDSTVSLNVHNIVHIDEHLDKYDSKEAEPRQVASCLSLLVFKGPFNLQGSAYFPGFDMIVNHIKRELPNVVVLMGPFIPDDLMAEGKLFEAKNFTIQDLREQNLIHLFKMVDDLQLQKNPEFVLIPDQSEADCFSVTPLQNNIEIKSSGLSIKVHKPGSPSIITLNGQYPIAFSSSDFILPLLKFPQKTTSKKYDPLLRELVSQRNLHPAFPLESPFDITQQDSLNFGSPFPNNTQTNNNLNNSLPPSLPPCPIVWISYSSLVPFATKARGTVFMNPKRVFEGEEFGHCGRVLIDTQQGDQAVRVDVLRF